MWAMRGLAQDVLRFVRSRHLFRPGDRVAVAVSGGADSVALLRLLLELRSELGIVLSAVHFNHKLRGSEADADEAFVRRLAAQHSLELHGSSEDVAAIAAEGSTGLEATARARRNAFFRSLIASRTLDIVATAHTRDDQAETVLLRLLRGAGWRGLAGIYPRVEVADSAGGTAGAVVRPLLSARRNDLRNYLQGLGQAWQEDSTNSDVTFLRNRVRHRLLPLLEGDFAPAVIERLAEMAEIAREEENYSAAQLEQLLKPPLWNQRSVAPAGAGEAGGGIHVETAELLQLPVALQRRVLRESLALLGVAPAFQWVEAVRTMAQQGMKELQLPSGVRVRQERRILVFEGPGNEPPVAAEYEYALSVPGRVEVTEAGCAIAATEVPGSRMSEGYNPDHLYDPDLLPRQLKVRNWRAGDRFWPAHSSEEKKIKELLTARKVVGWERRLWPVIASGDEVIWVRGFPAPAKFRPPQGRGIWIAEERFGMEEDGK